MNFKVNMENLTGEEQAELRRLVYKSNNKKPWKPKEGDTVFVIGETGEIDDYPWIKGSHFLEQTYCYGNVFRTKTEAQVEQQKKKIEARLKRFAEEHNKKIDWNDIDSRKYYIVYKVDIHQVAVIMACCYKRNDIFFSSAEIAKKAIEEIGEEDIKFWLGAYDDEYKEE